MLCSRRLIKTRVHHMPENQLQHQPVSVQCRFVMTAADAHSSHKFCVFEFPGWEGCPNAMHFIKRGLQAASAPKSSFVHFREVRQWRSSLVPSDRNVRGHALLESLSRFPHRLTPAR